MLEETKPDSYMTKITELSYREYKITMIYTLGVLIEKEDNMKE